MTDLDRKMAEVMGWEYLPYIVNKPTFTIIAGLVILSRGNGFEIWAPSTDISQAFEVVEVMRGKGFYYDAYSMENGSHVWVFKKHKDNPVLRRPGIADTPEMSIVLAAEKAMEGE